MLIWQSSRDWVRVEKEGGGLGMEMTTETAVARYLVELLLVHGVAPSGTRHTRTLANREGRGCCSLVARHTSNMTPCNATEYMQISIRTANQNKARTNNFPVTRTQSFVLGSMKAREQCHAWNWTQRKKLKLSLYLTKHYTMKTYGGVEV
jgi:hypothetical protein